MSPTRHLYIVAPVLNERPNLPRLMANMKTVSDALPEFHATVLVIDDGSTDGTAEEAERHEGDLDVQVLRHETNQGPGYAFGTAFEHLASEIAPDDLVVTMEGDNTSRIDTLIRMVERSDREQIDVILASPYAYGGGFDHISLYRTFLSHGANGFLRAMLGIRGINTMSSFFRVHRGEALATLQRLYGNRVLECTGFEAMAEMLKKMMIVGLSISEVPMRLNSADRIGKSKMRALRTIFGYFRLSLLVGRWTRMGIRSPAGSE